MSRNSDQDFGLKRTIGDIEDENRENVPLTLGQKLSIFFSGTGTQPNNYTLGADCSHWQGYVDWVKMKSKGIKFGITKGTDFYRLSQVGFVDDKSEQNCKGMTDNGILMGGYCWLQPKQDPKVQANFYLNEFYSKYTFEFPPILDFEDPYATSPSDYLWRAQVWLEEVERQTKRIPMIYTSSGYMMRFDPSKTGFLARYPLWTAQYIQRTYPSMYKPFSKWTMWQYSDRGHYPFYIYGDKNYYGRQWGVESGYLDMNYFNGDYVALLDFCQNNGNVVPPEPPQEDKVLFVAKCTANYVLNIRSGAGLYYRIVGHLDRDTIRNVYQISGGWYRIGENEWVSAAYMQEVKEDVPEPCPEVLFQAKCIVGGLNVRSGAGTQYPVIKLIKNGDIADVYQVSSNNWYKISKDKEEWCSGSTAYMVKV